MEKKLEQEKLDLIHKGILETVKEFVKICEENNFKYYMTGGTLIGAVRHQGFIPWDEDMDLFMPREDYEKFLNSYSNYLPSNLMVKHFSKDEIIQPWIKLENRNYEISRELLGNESKNNLFIDIFPLDVFPDNKIQRIIYKMKLFYRMTIVRFARLQLHNKNNDTKKNRNIIEKIIFKLDKVFNLSKHINFKKQQYKLDKLLKKYIYNNYNTVFMGVGPYGIFREIYPKELFEKTKKYEFENIELIGVVDYDKHLRQVYGDYMQLPPEEKRICKHIKDVKYIGK